MAARDVIGRGGRLGAAREVAVLAVSAAALGRVLGSDAAWTMVAGLGGCGLLLVAWALAIRTARREGSGSAPAPHGASRPGRSREAQVRGHPDD